MSEAGERLIEGAKEMLAVAKGEQPAARIHVNGHAYVPESILKAEQDILYRAGIIEIAVRNPSVSDYMTHWEGRTEKAEAEVARFKAKYESTPGEQR